MDGGQRRRRHRLLRHRGRQRNGAGVWVSLAQHRARGDGHDRLFRFENVEGSAFRDVLIGDGRANVIDGGPGDDTLRGGGGRRPAARRPGRRRLPGGERPHRLLRQGNAAESVLLHRARRDPRRRRGPDDRRRRRRRPVRRRLRRSELDVRHQLVEGDRGRPRLQAEQLHAGLLPRRPGALADRRPRSRRGQPAGRGLAGRGREHPLRWRSRRRHDQRRPGGQPNRGRPRRRPAARRPRRRRADRRPARARLTSTAKRTAT